MTIRLQRRLFNVPIYEYQCSKCSHRFEMIHGVLEKELKISCPKCGDSRPQRMVSSFSCGGVKGSDIGPGSACGPKPGRFS
ncbi:MAG: zinc ribbon domain-containing protein [Deltaproteobacteria bacterium]|nr:zinc ribbon domain-containing protein [Deltaproteobacteria bacterium]